MVLDSCFISHGPRSFQLVWLSRLIPGSSIIRLVLQWSSGTLGVPSIHSCFLPLLGRIASSLTNCWAWLSRCTSALLDELVTYMFASCSASVHYGITRKGWRPTCLQAAVLQFTTASRERVGDLHVCKLRCFSSLRHHAKGLATYMFASCGASVHYGITRKGWRPTCLQAAVLQFTTASRERVGDLHVCKLRCFSSLRHHAKGLATYMFASCRASLHEGINRWWLPCLLEVFCPHYSRGVADYLFAMSTADAMCFENRAHNRWQELARNIVQGAPNSEVRWLTPRGLYSALHVQGQCLVRRVALTVLLPSLGKFFFVQQLLSHLLLILTLESTTFYLSRDWHCQHQGSASRWLVSELQACLTSDLPTYFARTSGPCLWVYSGRRVRGRLTPFFEAVQSSWNRTVPRRTAHAVRVPLRICPW